MLPLHISLMHAASTSIQTNAGVLQGLQNGAKLALPTTHMRTSIAEVSDLHGDAEELEEALLGRPEQLEHLAALPSQLHCLAQCAPQILHRPTYTLSCLTLVMRITAQIHSHSPADRGRHTCQTLTAASYKAVWSAVRLHFSSMNSAFLQACTRCR